MNSRRLRCRINLHPESMAWVPHRGASTAANGKRTDLVVIVWQPGEHPQTPAARQIGLACCLRGCTSAGWPCKWHAQGTLQQLREYTQQQQQLSSCAEHCCGVPQGSRHQKAGLGCSGAAAQGTTHVQAKQLLPHFASPA